VVLAYVYLLLPFLINSPITTQNRYNWRPCRSNLLSLSDDLFSCSLLIFSLTLSSNTMATLTVSNSGKPDAFCFECVFMYHYKFDQCSHTICLTCLYDAIDEHMRLETDAFACPRCIDSPERRNRLEQCLIPIPNEHKEKRKKGVESHKPEQQVLNNHEPQLKFEHNNTVNSASFWPAGTESWHIHEIKPQRQYFTSKPWIDNLVTNNEPHGNHYESFIDLRTNDESDSYWPAGTESWHIHEIKPQREFFTSSNCTDKLAAENEYNLDRPEDLPGLTTIDLFEKSLPESNQSTDHPSLPTMASGLNPLKSDTITTDDLHTSSSFVSVTLSIDNQLQSLEEISHSNNKRHELSSQRNPQSLISNTEQLKSLLSQNFSAKKTSQPRCSDSLLLFIGHGFVLLLSLLFFIFMHTGVSYHVSPSLNSNHKQFSTPDSAFTDITIATTCTKIQPTTIHRYVKTIAILRNLESLLIYDLW
jgi:hypothetical protein